MGTPVVELKHVTKIFPGVVALDDMSLQIETGEIHGLIGENGAGKSTLIKVLTGAYIPDEGEIYIKGEKHAFHNPKESIKAGVACVYQELNICKDLTVVDNLFLGRPILKGKGVVDKRKMLNKTVEVLKLLGQDFSPNTTCGKLSVGQQQMVEIGKAILTEASVIVLDEPTSSLGETETEHLFKIVRKLRKEKNISFLFVSHKLDELFELCDSVTVMRDSKHIVTKPINEMTNDDLITYMVGRSFDTLFPHVDSKPGEVVLEVDKLTRQGEFYDVTFQARRGEILGISGLVGAGRSELFRCIFGVSEADSGSIVMNGKNYKSKNPRAAISNGYAYLTEDRKNEGLILPFSVKDNLLQVVMPNYKKGMKLDFKGMGKLADNLIDKLNIKVSSPNQAAVELSGGNQQKVVIGKWVSSDAEIYVFDEPTKGIDIGAKREVYKVMNNLVEDGKCVIMISSELQEILGMSDRVIVMRSGRVMKEILRESDDFNQDSIMKAEWGIV